MLKRIFIITFIAIFIIACQTGKEDAKKFSEKYTQTMEKLREQRSKVKTRDEYVAYNADVKRENEALLAEFEKSPSIEDIEILRSKVLLNLEKLDEAEQKIDAVLAKNPASLIDAKMTKVKILLKKKNYAEAYNVFKEIESQVKDPFDLFHAYYYIGSSHEDPKVKEEYAKKFLTSPGIPDYYVQYRTDMYTIAASVAKQQGNYDEARRVLTEAIADTKDERNKAFLEKTLLQLDYVGKPAFPIAVGTWLNSTPLKLQDLKGQVVGIIFWAPWCPSCREMTPSLVDIYKEYKDKGFTLIGYTRFHGTYSDDLADLGKVSKEEELENIKKYLERKQVPYPIAIADEKTDYESYKISGLPTLVIIDKKGNIDFTKIGGGDIQFIKDKIDKLLAEV